MWRTTEGEVDQGEDERLFERTVRGLVIQVAKKCIKDARVWNWKRIVKLYEVVKDVDSLILFSLGGCVAW